MEQQSSTTPNNDLIYGVLCYLGIFWVVSLLTNKKNEFFRLHLGQGLVVLILEIVLVVLGRLPLVRYIAGWFWFLPGLISTLAIVKTLTGDSMYHIPVVYDLSRNFKF